MIWHGLRTSEWKYVEYTTGERELYSLVSDPTEQVNLVDDTRYAEVAASLRARLAAERGRARETGVLPPSGAGLGTQRGGKQRAKPNRTDRKRVPRARQPKERGHALRRAGEVR